MSIKEILAILETEIKRQEALAALSELNIKRRDHLYIADGLKHAAAIVGREPRA